MDQMTQLIVLIAAAAVALVAMFLIVGRQRRDHAAATRESPFAISTEGEKRCPNCGMGNLWTETRCIACKAPLRG